MSDEYHSGSTHPEFEEWWEQFGKALIPRMFVHDIALAAWAASQDRTRAFLSSLRPPSPPPLPPPLPPIKESAQPCGCDPGIKYLCHIHLTEKERSL